MYQFRPYLSDYMEQNQKFKYDAPAVTVFEVQAEGCMVPSSWGHEEG